MSDLWKSVDGYKTYIALAAGGVVVVLNHFGVQVPGVHLDPNAYSQQLWTLLTGGAIRHGIG